MMNRGFGGFDFGQAMTGRINEVGNAPTHHMRSPARHFAPQSPVVESPITGLGSMGQWEADWQSRYNQTPQGEPGYDALQQEREQFEPAFQNQQRQQQAFNMMQGQGQNFGMMGPDYTTPGFGQVTGQTNAFAPEMGQNRAATQGVNEGLQTDWLTGVYDPSRMQAMGVYSPMGYGRFGM